MTHEFELIDANENAPIQPEPTDAELEAMYQYWLANEGAQFTEETPKVSPLPPGWENAPPLALAARMMADMGMDPDEADRWKDEMKDRDLF